MTRYVGVALHRRRSVIVVLDADGTELWTRRIDNDLIRTLLVMCASGVRNELKEAVHRVMIRTVMIRNHRRCR